MYVSNIFIHTHVYDTNRTKNKRQRTSRKNDSPTICINAFITLSIMLIIYA